jgi:hypothetical protein
LDAGRSGRAGDLDATIGGDDAEAAPENQFCRNLDEESDQHHCAADGLREEWAGSFGGD